MLQSVWSCLRRRQSTPLARDIFDADLDRARRKPGCALCRLVREHDQQVMHSFLWEYCTDPHIGARISTSWGFCSYHTWSLGVLDSNLSRFHQVLNRARWSPLELSRQLLLLIMESFIQAGGGIDIVIDETLERRWGAKISKRGHYRDSALSSRKRLVSSPGLRWIVMAVVVTLPWTEASLGLALSVCPGNDP